MPMNRNQFLRLMGAGAAAAAGTSLLGFTWLLDQDVDGPARSKHWAWLRGDPASLDEWRRLLAGLRRAGITAVLPNNGNPDFYRRHVPVAAEEGVEVHAWIFTMMRGGMEREHPEWYAVNRSGVSTAERPPYVDYYKFLCPSRDEVRQHLLEHVRTLAQVDGLASVHLDYVRYPDVILPVALWPTYGLVQDREYPEFDYCYCTVCRERFRQRTGLDPRELADPPANEAWVRYRYDSVTEVVNRLADEVHAQGKQITAAVFPTPAIARRLVRQDWTKWKLDAALPMVYHSFYEEDVEWIGTATREGVEALAGRIPLYSGLYIPDLAPQELATATELALSNGAQGVSLFEGHMPSQDHWEAFAAVTGTR